MRILIILITLLIFFLLPSQTFAHSTTQVIEMTSNGFEPQKITIDKNSSIIFINKDKVARWPASNVHPTHEIYPEFDPHGDPIPDKNGQFSESKSILLTERKACSKCTLAGVADQCSLFRAGLNESRLAARRLGSHRH